MFVKFLNWLGIAACLALIVSCFLPWSYYADLNQSFTGFYSYGNYYGKPGKLIVFFAVCILVFMIVPKIWAKRTNLFLTALLLAYAFKTFVLFGSCYNNACPKKLFSLYLMLGCAIIMLMAAVFPDVKLKQSKT